MFKKAPPKVSKVSKPTSRYQADNGKLKLGVAQNGGKGEDFNSSTEIFLLFLLVVALEVAFDRMTASFRRIIKGGRIKGVSLILKLGPPGLYHHKMLNQPGHQ